MQKTNLFTTLREKKSLLIIILLQIIILAYALCNFFTTKANLYSQTFLLNELTSLSPEISEEKIIINNLNTGAGAVVSTKPLQLGRGSYIATIDYFTDTEGNTLSASCLSLPVSKFESNPATLSTKMQTAYIQFRTGYDAEDVTVSLNFQGSGTIEVYNLYIQETTDMAKQDLLYSVGLCILLSLGYYICTTALSKRKIAFCLGAIIILASYPLFLDYMAIGHDLPFHLLRIDGIKTGLEQGIFPVKIQPVWAYDYGYATGVFYGDILLYFPALLRLLGFSVQSAYVTFVAVINIATALIAYFSFNKMFSSARFGLIGCMLYTLSYYRLLNVYTRAAVGEYCAMMFLPLLFVGLYQIFTMTEKKGWWKKSIMPAIGLAGIIHTHVLTCEMVALFIILACIVFVKRLWKERVFLSLALTVILTLLLTISFLVPFMDYYFTESFIINSEQWTIANVQSMGLYLTQVFGIMQSGVGGSNYTSFGVINEFSPGLGLPLVIGLFVCGYYLLTTSKEEKRNTSYYVTLFTFISSIIAVILSTHHFPWDILESSGALGKAIVSSLQFPWRFMSLATLLVTIGTCFAIKQLSKKTSDTSDENKISVLPVATIVLCITTFISVGWYYYSFLSVASPYRMYDTYELPSTQLYSCEYLPEGSLLVDIKESRYDASEGLIYSDITKEGTYFTCHIENSDSEGYLDVPMTSYKGYEATHVETGAKLDISNGFNNCIRITIPKGFSGTLEIKFVEPTYWKVAEVITGVSFLLLIGFGIAKTIISHKSPKDTLL